MDQLYLLCLVFFFHHEQHHFRDYFFFSHYFLCHCRSHTMKYEVFRVLIFAQLTQGKKKCETKPAAAAAAVKE